MTQPEIPFDEQPKKSKKKQPTGGNWRVEQGEQMSVDDCTTVVMIRYHGQDPYMVITDADTHGDAEATAKLIASAHKMRRALLNIREMAKDSGSYLVRRLDAIAMHAMKEIDE